MIRLRPGRERRPPAPPGPARPPGARPSLRRRWSEERGPSSTRGAWGAAVRTSLTGSRHPLPDHGRRLIREDLTLGLLRIRPKAARRHAESGCVYLWAVADRCPSRDNDGSLGARRSKVPRVCRGAAVVVARLRHHRRSYPELFAGSDREPTGPVRLGFSEVVSLLSLSPAETTFPSL
jgi:hypothetical protein